MKLVDVREKEETRAGMLPSAISVPRGFLEMQIESKAPDRNERVRSAILIAFGPAGRDPQLSLDAELESKP